MIIKEKGGWAREEGAVVFVGEREATKVAWKDFQRGKRL